MSWSKGLPLSWEFQSVKAMHDPPSIFVLTYFVFKKKKKKKFKIVTSLFIVRFFFQN